MRSLLHHDTRKEAVLVSHLLKGTQLNPPKFDLHLWLPDFSSHLPAHGAPVLSHIQILIHLMVPLVLIP